MASPCDGVIARGLRQASSGGLAWVLALSGAGALAQTVGNQAMEVREAKDELAPASVAAANPQFDALCAAGAQFDTTVETPQALRRYLEKFGRQKKDVVIHSSRDRYNADYFVIAHATTLAHGTRAGWPFTGPFSLLGDERPESLCLERA